VQELVDKYEALPKDIRWHFIGHLQTNKVKYIAPFVHLIHGVDSEKLLIEINKQGEKLNKKISCLLQIYIAKEETKFGLDEVELENIIQKLPQLPFVQISGMMGMASFSSDSQIVKTEFDILKHLFDKYSSLTTDNLKMETLSMGMSGDYKMAISCGSNMVRIGSMLFGEREYKK
jgi:pyridoxal phosphate enzyme (YggS family)